MAQVPNVAVDFDGDGTTAIFDFDFPYQKQSEIFVSVDGVNVAYTWLAGNTHSVQVLPAPTLGTKVRIYRSTLAFIPLHVFAAGVPFLPRYVDENNRQMLYVAQESINTANTAETIARGIADVAEDAFTAAEAAQAVAGDAQAVAGDALGIAQGIATTANSALVASGQAVATANNALGVANSIDAKATTALANSVSAVNTANGIDAKATTALANSIDAVTASNEARFDAAEAVARANEAKARSEDAWVSVLSYGAIPGQDCTAAFAAAQLAARTNRRAVIVPGSTLPYLVKDLVITAPIIGTGRDSVIKRHPDATGTWLTVGSAYMSVGRVTLDASWASDNLLSVDGKDGFALVDSLLKQCGGTALHWNGVHGLRVRDVDLDGVSNGMSNLMPQGAASAAISTDISISGGTIRNVFGSGIYLAGKQSATDPDFHFDNPLIVGASISDVALYDVAGHGVLVQGRSVTLTAVRCQDVGNGPGLQSIVAQGDDINVIACRALRGMGVGIDMGRCTNSAVVACKAIGCGEIGIELQGCTNLTLSTSTAIGCARTLVGNRASAGIQVGAGFWPGYASTGITVTGCTVRRASDGTGGEHGISVTGTSSAILIGNDVVGSRSEEHTSELQSRL